MSRRITLGVAQTGPVARGDTRAQVVARLTGLLRRAHERGCKLVVFPELALTTFFPRFLLDSEEEIDSFFEREMPGPETRPLFELAQSFGIGFYLGFAELDFSTGTKRRFNTSILVNRAGRIIGRYRKIHLPGRTAPELGVPWQNLEKRYFTVGDLGWRTWRTMGGVMGMAICNDRRWPETYRMLGLQGAELIMLGYNSAILDPRGKEPPEVRMLHNHVTMQAGAYQNASWVAAAAKSGEEEGVALMGGSCIISATAQIVAQAITMGEELISAECDLDICQHYKRTMFNFAAHRRVEHYRLITEQTGAIAPEADADSAA
ncbi:MAG: N-carbamoyl-D-amino-acid hydrolase [Alphaproteobacteria bacterium]|nr:N-carbamoyl-D-amino-acid hydrolase [Alphaproteobacteria bacterium]